MKQSSENLGPNESLSIITNMIAQAKGNVKNNSFFFLLWGWVVMVANLGMFVLIQVGYPYPYYIWSITIPAWILTLYKSFRMSREKGTKTHFDTINGTLWLSFGLVTFTLVVFGQRLNYQLNPIILTFVAMPTFVTGVILRFKPLLLGGVIFWIAGIMTFLVAMEYQFLIGAISVGIGYLIPGYLLKNKKL